MSFETDIIAKYEAAIGGRLYWDTAPTSWTPDQMIAPFCIMQLVGGDYRMYVDGTEHEFLNARVQFFVWGRERIAVSDAMRSLSHAIAESGAIDWIVLPSGAPSGDYNDVLKLRGSRQDFGFWFKNPLYVE